jgi:hypothetical protein
MNTNPAEIEQEMEELEEELRRKMGKRRKKILF